MKLYEICNEIEVLFEECGEEEPSELPAEVRERLEALRISLSEKLSNIWALIKNLSAEAEALNAEAARLRRAAKARENRVQALKNYVTYCLGEGTRWKSPDGTREFSWRRSEAVEVQDESAIPDCYCAVERRILLTELKRDLKSGATVPGATLVQRMNLQVR